MLQVFYSEKQLEISHVLSTRIRCFAKTNPELVKCMCIVVTLNKQPKYLLVLFAAGLARC